MPATRPSTLARTVALGAAALLLASCDDDGPTTPSPTAQAVATLRAATERYHDLDAAVADGFVFLHGCEVRPGEGPAGMLYVHMGRLTDGAIDAGAPDALLYEPAGAGGSPALVGVELAVPYTLWTGQQPPTFLGTPFQREDEFGVFALHVWVWRENPEGLFAESNPRVACDGD